MSLDYCLEKGLLKKIAPNKDYSEKEWKEAFVDLEAGKAALAEGKAKWAIVAFYYSMFHAAKAVMFLEGWKESAHYAVAEYLQDLAKRGKLESRFANDFSAAMSLRQSADYHYDHSEQSAKKLLFMCEEFLEAMKKVGKVFS